MVSTAWRHSPSAQAQVLPVSNRLLLSSFSQAACVHLHCPPWKGPSPAPEHPLVCPPAVLRLLQVQPEFSLRILDDTYAKENKTIRQVQVRPASCLLLGASLRCSAAPQCLGTP